MSSHQELQTLAFLFQHSRLDPQERDDHFIEPGDEELKHELAKGDDALDIEKGDL